MRISIIGATIGLLFTGAASAQDRNGDHGAAALQPLIACRSIAAPEAQLNCYREATAALEEQVRQKQVRIIDHQDVRKVNRSLFGFTLPRIDLFSSNRDDEEVKQVDTTIASVRPIANGHVQFKVAEGDAEWATTEPLPFLPRSGTKVRIKKGPLGSYFIAIAGEPSVRGMRVK